MSDDITEIKKSNWKLKQELEAYKQETTRLNQTVQQWYNWSQEMQVKMQEKDYQIETLQGQVSVIEHEKNEMQNRLKSANVSTTENLYEQNKRLELKLKEMENNASTLEELVFRVLSKNVQIEARDAARVLKNSHKPEFKVYAYLFEQGNPTQETDVATKLSLSSRESEQAFSKLLRDRLIEEYTSGVYIVTKQISATIQETVTKDSGSPVVTSSPGQQDIFSLTASKLNYASSSQESSGILSDLKDYLISQGLSNLSFEILQVIRNLKEPVDNNSLQKKVKEWQRMYESAQEVETVVEEVDLMSLNTHEIFEVVRNQIKGAGKVSIAANYLDQMKDILMQKALASGTLLYDMNKTVNEAKKGSTTTGNLLSKLDDWETRIG
ncbi:MAG: hypothetical protein ACXAEU_06410 [Candidatus Hodarchaeales archaeon]|jgi:hypothetical protein